MNLYDLQRKHEELVEFLAERRGVLSPEDAQTLDAMEQAIGDGLTQKAAAYIQIIRERESMAEVRKQESSRLRDLARQDESVVEHLKLRLMSVMQGMGEKRIETPVGKISLCQNSVAPVVFSPDIPVPASYLRMEPDTGAIRAALLAGEDLDFAVFGERGFHVRIK